jgi:hypothetical protein
MKQRANSWQMRCAQSKPGGQAVAGNVRHSKLAAHSALAVHGVYVRHRPAVALVQYWPSGQSALVAHAARSHRPASQMSPWPPHEASFTHRRRQSPSWHT